jgi:ABC-type branched-subunit amino acid transport system permease subunit
MSSTLTGALSLGTASASVAAGASALGALATQQSVYAVSLHPSDVEPWLILLGNAVFTSINGCILIYHIIGKARRHEARLWRKFQHVDESGPRPEVHKLDDRAG